MDEQVYQVIGTQDGFFQTQEGQLRAYCNLFCIAPFRGEQSDTNHFKGHKALKFKRSSADVIKDIKPKDHVALYFDQYQRVSMIKVVTD